MLIGVDLDNTIISYQASLRHCVAALYPQVDFFDYTKDTVKEALLAQPEGMNKWMRLQGKLYGYGLKWAQPYSGVVSLLSQLQEMGHEIVIVSHKTLYGHFDEDRVNLHDAALYWLDRHLFASLVGRVDTHFCLTQDEKVNTIATLGCDVFIDDLFEIFDHPNFPPNIKAIHFNESNKGSAGISGRTYQCASWEAIHDIVLGCA